MARQCRPAAAEARQQRLRHRMRRAAQADAVRRQPLPGWAARFRMIVSGPGQNASISFRAASGTSSLQ
jgi:hypothetical protein